MMFEVSEYREFVDDLVDQEVDSYFMEEEEVEMDQDVDLAEDQALLDHHVSSNKPLSRLKQMYLERQDPFDIDDLEFYKTYRFSKQSVKNLTQLIFPEKKKTNRGLPFDPEQVVCTALKHLGGVSFKYLYKDGTKATALRHFNTFITELNKQKDKLMELPSVEMMTSNIKEVWNKFHLWNIVGTLGCTEVLLRQKPRGVGDGDKAKMYKNKAGQFAFNVEIVAGMDNLIYGCRIFEPASLPESWEKSTLKSYLDLMIPRVHLLGEPDQTLSDTVITPYPSWETLNNQHKALFNLRHSMARSEMAHRTLELWRKRFPRLKNPNYKVEVIKDVLEATLILHNISILWQDHLPQEILESSPLADPIHTVHEEIHQKLYTESSVRVRGELLNSCLKAGMQEDERQVLNLTMPVQMIVTDQLEFSHSVFFTYPATITDETAVQNL